MNPVKVGRYIPSPNSPLSQAFFICTRLLSGGSGAKYAHQVQMAAHNKQSASDNDG